MKFDSEKQYMDCLGGWLIIAVIPSVIYLLIASPPIEEIVGMLMVFNFVTLAGLLFHERSRISAITITEDEVVFSRRKLTM